MTDLTPEQNGGVLKTILVEGSGDSPMTGDTVSVHYVGTLLDGGEQFDSSRDRDQKFEFTLGTGQVIKGWDLGVASMKKGEKCDLICKADYAYGKDGSSPKIPGDATLKFEVELFDFFGEDISDEKDKSIQKRILNKGGGWTTPNDGARLKVEIEGFTVPGNESFGIFDGDLLHGEECANGFPKFIETVLDDMKTGEKCELTVTSKHGFREASAAFANAPLKSDMKFVINLKTFEKEKESWEMNSEEKIQQAELKRDSAKNYLEKGNLEMAIKFFDKVVKILEDEIKGPRAVHDDLSDSDDEEGEKAEATPAGDSEAQNGKVEAKTDPRVLDLLETSHLNLSLCFLKSKNYNKAMEHCDDVLSGSEEVAEARMEKALFRKAECLLSLHEYDKAKSLFGDVVQQFPKNATARKRLEECSKRAKEEKEKEKQRYQRMFKNFST